MPRGDRTGPVGMGTRTGRAAGYCSGSGVPGYANSGPGRGLAMGFGRGRGAGGPGFGGGGRGRRNMVNATGLPGRMRFGGIAEPYGYPAPYQKPDPEMERRALKNQAETLQCELDLIKKRLGEVEAKTSAE